MAGRDHDAAQATELRRLRAEAAAAEALIGRLREDAVDNEAILLAIRDQLASAEAELGDLRAIRDALTPPDLPRRPGLELAASFQPAAPQVSGDFYLATAGPGDTTVVVIGDVVGKGIEAARRAAFVRTSFLTTAAFTDDPCRLLEWTNAALTERVGYNARFASAVCVTYDPARRRMRWAIAGHPAPLRLGSGDELQGGRRGTLLGIGDHVRCEGADVAWPPGEGMLLYTDGLTEARLEGRLFGTERVQRLLRESSGRPAGELLTRLRDAATAHAGGTLQDDLCMIVITAV